MRYPAEHKGVTRGRILNAAARAFRRKGVSAVGVADIMSDEGLTHGGFYRHFKGKEELLIASVETALQQVAGQLLRETAHLSAPQALEWVIRFYLSEDHMKQPQEGCAFAALGTELARYPKRCRAPIARALDRYRLQLQCLLPGRSENERRANFEVLFPSMAGCLTAARTQVDVQRSKEILSGACDFFVRRFCAGHFDEKERKA